MVKELKLHPEQLIFITFLLIVCSWSIFRLQGPDITNINAYEAKALIDSGATIIDVRGEGAFDTRHLEGAISIPLSVLKIAIPAEIESIKTKDIVVYCGDGVTVGPVATQILNKAGFAKAVNLKPGINGWRDAGYKIIKKET